MRYARNLDTRWAHIMAIPGKRERCKQILRIIKEVESVLIIMKKVKEQESEIEDAIIVMERWYKRHWRAGR